MIIGFFKERFFQNRTLIFQFIKFCIVGTLGTIIDFGLLNLLYQIVGLSLYISATLSFIAAVVNNFLFNKYWTFKNISTEKKRNVQLIQFFMVSTVGLGINLAVMSLLVEHFGIWYNWAKAVAIIVVLFWNFSANKLWTFKGQKNVQDLPK